MNVTGLEQLHQSKSHDETYGRPFEASQSGIQHPARILAQPKAMLKRTRSNGILGPNDGQFSTTSCARPVIRQNWIDFNAALCLRSPV